MNRIEAIVAEAQDHQENCKYTAAAMFEWQKCVRFWKNLWIVLPIVLGALASSQVLQGVEGRAAAFAIALAGLLAGLLPAIYDALGIEIHEGRTLQLANEYSNLRDRFRALARMAESMSDDEAGTAFEELISRLEAARQQSPSIPDKYFDRGSIKVKSGVYEPDERPA